MLGYKNMENKFLLVSVNMGYGHQRTAFPLKQFSYGNKIIQCNDYEGIPKKDKKIWSSSKDFYEIISRFKKIPLLGKIIFSSFDKLQEIKDFYPKRDLSSPNFMLKRFYNLFKKGWGKDFIEKNNQNIPFVSTFFVPAFMAEYFNYKGEIYCIVCDADISRSWAPFDPKKSRIKYFVPNSWTKSRLKMYGVKEENIFLTGYPLPIENIGEDLELLKEDIKKRLLKLDPQDKYIKNNISYIESYIGKIEKIEKNNSPINIAFSIGGAGAQKEIAIEIIKSIKKEIKDNKINILIMAGIREEVKSFFEKEFKKEKILFDNSRIIFDTDINNYFSKFNREIRNVDIIWTKPSELSFYSGLGLPIIIAPTIGSQEDFNKKWLLRIGTGINQENPSYSKDWLIDYINSGRFAECLINSFNSVEKKGVYNILKVISKK